MIRSHDQVRVKWILSLTVMAAILRPKAVATTFSKNSSFPPTFEMLLVHSLHSSGVISAGDTPLPSRLDLTGRVVSNQFKALAAIFYLDFGVPMTVSRNVGRVLRPHMFSFPLSHATSPASGPLQVTGPHLNGALQLRCANVTLSSVPAQPELYMDGLQVPTHLVPLPQAARASGESNAVVALLAASARSARATNSSVPAMVLLRLRSRSRAYASPVVEALERGLGRQATTTEVEAFVRDRCVVDVLPPVSQSAWPPTVLRSRAGGAPVRTAFGPGWRAEARRSVSAASVAVWDPRRDAVGAVRVAAPNYLRLYPEVQQEWSPVVPPMPPYCGLRNGSLPVTTVQELRAHHENVFLETTGKQAPPKAMEIMKAFCAIFMPPMMDPILGQVITHVDHSVSDQTGHEAVATAPTAIVDRLTKALTYNLTSIMTDSIAAELVGTVTATMTMQMAPRVATQVRRHLLPRLRKRIAAHLHVTLPKKVGAVVSYLLERSLAPILTTQVTRAVTHALVPTLTLALSHDEDQVVWCRACYDGADSTDCAKCRYSPVAQFYLNYYATYYSDYYAEYYQRYYADALRKMDRQQHPEPDQEEALKVNAGLKAKDREDDDLGEDAYLQGGYDMRRAMTPSGISVN